MLFRAEDYKNAMHKSLPCVRGGGSPQGDSEGLTIPQSFSPLSRRKIQLPLHKGAMGAAAPEFVGTLAKSTAHTSGAFWHDQVYKPGSVLTAIYLVPQLLTGSSRLPGTVGSTICSSTALLRIEFTAPQCSHGASALLPHFFTMTG